jgi:uncharacterized membrane protein YjgN (DUF898 family)
MTFAELPGAVPSGAVANHPASAVPSVPERAAGPVRFTGNGRVLLWLLIRGALLLAITLGIYRFWLATDVRRFLWVNTEVDGDSIEYAGTPLELLIGFLIAIAVLVPIYVGLFVLALNLGEVGQFMGILALPLLAFLGQFAVYRARRYRLTRTVFRGIRFHQGGSALRYAVCAMFWWLLIALTVGLAYPFAQAALERFKMQHTNYGNLRGRFDGSGFELLRRGFLMWLLVVAPIVGAIAYPVMAIDWGGLRSITGGDPEELLRQFTTADPGLARALGSAAALAYLSFMFAVLLLPVFQATVMRWWINGLRIGEVAISSQLRVGTIYYSYVRFLGWSMLLGLVAIIVGAIGAVALVVAAKSGVSKGSVEILGVIAAVGFYVAIMLGYSTIYQATVKLTLWRHSVETVAIANLAALDNVTAEGAPSSALGEGLADALNVGGI